MELASTPLTADVALAFGLAVAGILFVLFNKNVKAKRVVLLGTLVVFHALVYVIIERAGALPTVPRWAIVTGLLLNASWVVLAIRYCRSCGRTLQAPLFPRQPVTCPKCAAG